MTSLKLSSAVEDEVCPKCQGPLTWRQAYPFPLASQTAFGVSFILFMIEWEKIRHLKLLVWAWSLVQIGLGAWLIRGRIRSKIRVLRCIRCGSDLP